MQNLITLLVVFLAVRNGFCQDNFNHCPAGNKISVEPDIDEECDRGGVKFFIGMDSRTYCCDKAAFHPCDDTKMVSRFVCKREGAQLVYCMTPNEIEPEETQSYTYENFHGYRVATCPFPLNYLYYNIYVPPERPAKPSVEYFPVDWKGENKGHLSACQKNADCQIGQFCGDVINRSENDKYPGRCLNDQRTTCMVYDDCPSRICIEDSSAPYWDEERKFCYKNPKIPDQYITKQQFAMLANQPNFKLCHKTENCQDGGDKSLFCNTDLVPKNMNGKFWTSYEDSGNGRGVRNEFSGICMQAKSISYTFSNIHDAQPDEKYLAIGAETTQFRDNLKKCAKNAECDQGQYCGNIISLTENLEFDTQHMFCFIVPDIVNPPTPNNKYTVLPEKLNLVTCDSDNDCKTAGATGSFCHLASGLKYVANVGGSQKKLFNGLCADGASTLKQCKIGGQILTTRQCGNDATKAFAECNGGLAQMTEQTNKLDAWCDESINECCHDPTIGFCPDGQTPLFNEPKCDGYDESQVESGTCLAKTGAVCKFGHCCPNAKPDANGKVVRPDVSYPTEIPCKPGVRPPQFPDGYCDPTTGKVIIIGRTTPTGEPMKGWPDDGNPQQCQKDVDCSTDNSKLCIFDGSSGNCYVNPSAPSQPQAPVTQPTVDPQSHQQQTQISQITTSTQGAVPSSSGSQAAPATSQAEGEDSSSTIIIIVVVIALLVIIVAALIVAFVVFKMKSKKKGNKGKKGKKGKETKNKKNTKAKGKAKKKEPTTPSKSNSMSSSITGGTGTNMTSGGYSPAIH